MKVYTYTEARQKLAALLDRASREGEVRIKRQDGTEFVLRVVPKAVSPLAVTGVSLDLGSDEIVEAVREGRERRQP